MTKNREVKRLLLGATMKICLLFGMAAVPLRAEGADREKAEHVLLIVWDGMRPDFVTEAYAPTLTKLAAEGVTFRNHHSVYPSLTSVNATALATGVYPSRSGLIANYEFRPAINPGKPVRMDTLETARKGDESSSGKFLNAATIAEMVQASGGRCAIAGTKTASILHYRQPSSAAEKRGASVTLFDGITLPEAALGLMTKLLGPFPGDDKIPNTAQDSWTTRALTESLWKEGVPEFSLLWMSDPDRSQHATSPGSPEAIAGIKSADNNLAVVLQALEEKGVRDKTDIFVVSDHGFSSIERSIDVAALMKTAGFHVFTGAETKPARGEIRFAGNGGTNLFYVAEHDAAAIEELVEWLQQSDFAGVIFTKQRIKGTFPFSDVHIDSPSAPDVAVAMRWTDGKNKHGVAGLISSNGTGEAGRGTHGTLSLFDVHNTMIAAGPDLRRASGSDLPSANLDVAPTILHLLGLKPPQPLDGRVLTEALGDREDGPKESVVRTMESLRESPAGIWRQYLRLSEVESSTYIDEGNGEFRPRATPEER